MTQKQWQERMELLSASIICEQITRCWHKRLGLGVFVGLSALDDRCAVITVKSLQAMPALPLAGPALMFPWGKKSDLAKFIGVYVDSSVEVYADGIIEMLADGKWDVSKDSPAVFRAEFIVTEPRP